MDRRWDLKQLVLKDIAQNGGWANAHAHLDRAFTITPQALSLSNRHLHEKWKLVDEVKRKSSVGDIYDRMAFALERLAGQGVTAVGSFIDVDEVVEDKAIRAAQKLRSTFRGNVTLRFINQTLKGVLEPMAYSWFQRAAQFVDIIGGLPAKDAHREAEHLDVLLGTAREMKKLVHVHVDQLNTPKEKETELLVRKTEEHGMEGRVAAIHGISIAAQRIAYRRKLYQKMKNAGVMLITCPTAWIDARRSEEVAPIHNAIAPVEEMVEAGITVGLGTDNIADVYKPFTDGDMWTELRFLLETCHYYDLQQLARIATTNGRKVLGI